MKSIIPLLCLLLGLSPALSTLATPTIPNPSFEADSYAVSPGYASGNGGVITGWTLSTPANIGLNINGIINPGLFANNGLIPDGTNVAFIQSLITTNVLSTTISGLDAGTIYQVTFRANCRSGYGAPNASWSLNGGDYIPFTCYPAVGAGQPYYTNSATFTATGTTAALALQNHSPGDTTVVLDDFSIKVLFSVPIVVTTTNDSGPGSLRDAVANAPGSALISFAPALTGHAITLTNGSIAITTNLAIDASGVAGGMQINGNSSSRIFSISSGVTAALTSLIITNGNAGDYGGGLFNQGNLTVNRCTFTGNQSLDTGFGGGGAILTDSSATLTVNECTFTGNQAYEGGGAIWNNGSGILYVNNSTFFGNISYHGGGGIQNNFTGTTTINNSTFIGNSATTIAGGIYNYSGGSLFLTNSIVCGNSSVGDIYGPINGASSNLVSVTAQLAPLGNYGGPTQTMPPLPGSAAIDAGAPTSLTTDQRGYPRLAGLAPDIGAVEGIYVAAGPGNLTLTNAGSSIGFSFTNLTDASFRVFATTNLSQPASTWTPIGFTTETPAGSGLYQFTDPQADTAFTHRFYRVKSP